MGGRDHLNCTLCSSLFAAAKILRLRLDERSRQMSFLDRNVGSAFGRDALRRVLAPSLGQVESRPYEFVDSPSA
jgi:hypothetical protein